MNNNKATRPCWCNKPECKKCTAANTDKEWQKRWNLDDKGMPLEKSLWYKTGKYLVARKKWKKAGAPMRTLPEINYIYDNICKVCPLFENDTCKECGCNIKRNTQFMNKLAMKTEECPLDPPKWTSTFVVPEAQKEPVIKKKKGG